MNWLYENPLMILLAGVLLVTVLGGAWLQSGQRALLYGAGIALVLTLLGLFIERSVVTEAERVEATIHRIARDVEKGDLPTLLNHVHPMAESIRARAAAEFPMYAIKQVTVKSGMKVVVTPDNLPPKATAEFNVVVEGADRAGVLGEQSVGRFVIVTLLKDGDVWKISNYEHHEATHGMRLPTSDRP